MALTKAQIAETIAGKNGFAKNKSIQVVEDLLEIIKQTLESGEDLLVSGFGKFCVKTKKQRRGESEKNRGRLKVKIASHMHDGKITSCQPSNPPSIN